MAKAKGGFIVVFNRIPEVIARVEATSRSAPKRVADVILRDAQARAPVRTGELRASGESVSIESGKSAEVRFNALYAGFVEYGTYKMSARPYLTPAFEAHKHELGIDLLLAAELKI